MKWKELTNSWRAQGVNRGRVQGVVVCLVLALILWLVYGCGTPSSPGKGPVHVPVLPDLQSAVDLNKAITSALDPIGQYIDWTAATFPLATQRAEAVRIPYNAARDAASRQGAVLTGTLEKEQGNVKADAENAAALAAKTAENAKLKDAEKARMNWWWNTCVIVGSVLLVLGIVVIALASYYAPKAKPIGYIAAAVGIVAIGLGLTMLEWGKWVPFAFVGTLVAIGIAWYIRRLRQDAAETAAQLVEAEAANAPLEKAVTQITKTAQAFTKIKPGDAVALREAVALTQDTETSDLVKEVKAEAGLASLPKAPATPEAAP